MKPLLLLMLVAPLSAQAHSVDVPHNHGQFGQLFSQLLHVLSSIDHWAALLAVGLVVSVGLGLVQLLRARRG